MSDLDFFDVQLSFDEGKEKDWSVESMEKYFPESSLIERLSFSQMIDAKGREICPRVMVYFKVGGEYEYQCDKEDYLKWIEAESVGKYWHANVKGRWTLKIIKPMYEGKPSAKINVEAPSKPDIEL